MPDDAPIDDITPESPPLGQPEEIGPTFDLTIFVEASGLACRFECEGRREEWTMPKTVVRRVEKAVPIDSVFDLLGAGPVLDYYLRNAVTNEPQFLMVPRAVNSLTDRVIKALRKIQKDIAKANAPEIVEDAAEPPKEKRRRRRDGESADE